MKMAYLGFSYQPNYDVHSFNEQVQGHNGYPYMTYDHQHQHQQHMVLAAQLHHQQTAAMAGQGGISQARPTESKPRLAKDEVETLEREFNKNPKPNSSLKRDLADQMRVDVSRINNWFQNRRAKAKQIKKTQEFEAQQAAERAVSEPEGADDQDDNAGESEFYGLSNHSQPVQPNSAPFSDVDDSPTHHFDTPSSHAGSGVEDEDTSATHTSPHDHRSDLCDDMESAQFDYQASHLQFQPTDASAFHGFNGSGGHSGAPEPFRDPISHIGITIEDHSERGDSISGLSGFGTPHEQVQDSFQSFRPLTNNDSIAQYSSSVPTYMSHFLALDTKMEKIKTEEPSSYNPGSNEVSPNHLSPTSIHPSPTTTTVDLRFKSDPSPRIDIATRRNLRRPAQLNPTAFRTCAGPKTGIEMPKRSEAGSPMRRIASANGSMPGRIQKPTLGLPPRSPMFSDRNREAFLQSLQGALSPVEASDCYSNAGTVGTREMTASSGSPDEEQRYNYVPNSYFNAPTVSRIQSPPGTPGFQQQQQQQPQQQQPRYPINTMEAGWGFGPSDDALVTPGLGSFGSEMEFPASQSAPGYAASQPVTPSFARPAFYPVYTGNGAANLGYKFPESMSNYGPESSARSSPVTVPGSRSFQFTQNITPQDFTSS